MFDSQKSPESMRTQKLDESNGTQVNQATSISSANHFLSGVIFVVLGASSYGMLSTFVKLAYAQGYTTAEVTIAQFVWGVLGLSLMSFFAEQRVRSNQAMHVTFAPSAREKLWLAMAGLSIGFTSVFYYAAVQFIAASVAVVLLMQSVWIGVVIESFQTKSLPSRQKVFAVVMILVGTLLATNLIGHQSVALDPRGLALGLLAAISFAFTMYSSNSIASRLSSIKRSQWMMIGGSLVVLIFAWMTQSRAFEMSILYKHGLFVAIFGTIIPPVMMNRGFPIVGIGLGSILSSIELPFAVIIASLLLGEKVLGIQWLGVAMILGAVVMLNLGLIRPKSSISKNQRSHL